MTMNLSVILQISHANMLTGFLNLHSEEANKKKSIMQTKMKYMNAAKTHILRQTLL